MPQKYIQNGIETEAPDFRQPFDYVMQPTTRLPRPVARPEKDCQYRERAAHLWPGLEIVGSGSFVFVSKCENKVCLFKTADEARARTCRAGANCTHYGHERVRMKYVPPIRLGGWQD